MKRLLIDPWRGALLDVATVNGDGAAPDADADINANTKADTGPRELRDPLGRRHAGLDRPVAWVDCAAEMVRIGITWPTNRATRLDLPTQTEAVLGDSVGDGSR